MLAGELEALLAAHAFLRVERPPTLWAPDAGLEPFVRLLGEMIAAALVRNGGELSQVTLNVSNVVVEPSAAESVPEGEFVALTARGAGEWQPEGVWRPGDVILVNDDLARAAEAAGARYGYSRALGSSEGSVTVFVPRAAA